MSDALKSRRAGAGSRRQSPLPLGITSGWGIENKLFTEQRFLVYGSIVGVAYAIICWGWLFASRGTLCVDFTWMWVSGAFAGSSDAVRVYDLSAFSAAWRILTGLGGCMLANSHFDYPPTFLFFLYPLGLMPYSVAFVVWMVATLLLYLAAVYVILPRPAAVIAALTPFTVLGNFLLGHNGFLTAGLIGLSLAFIERWPWVSGVFLGFLTYKPQFGILFPFALLASRNWRAVVSATAMSVTLGAAAAIAFGYQTWPLFIGSLIAREPDLSPAPGLPTPLVSIYGFLQQTGVSTRISAAVHLAVAVIITAAVCYVWAEPIPHSLKAASLSIGSVTVTPYALGYDFCVLSIAVAFLVSDGLSHGFLRCERTVMLSSWLGLFFPARPVPLIICFVLFALVARRVIAYRGRSTDGRDDDAGSSGSHLIARTC